VSALYLGEMAATVKRADTNQQQLVELITTGQSTTPLKQPDSDLKGASA
jgi:D-xylose transport system ATP-binding protein